MLERRQILFLMAGAGALAAGSLAAAAPAAAPAAESGSEKVLGIGGFFFRAKDPAALAQWYRDHLGIALIPEDYNTPPWQQQAGPTAFAPFPKDTKYFGADTQMWMLNFRVRDLDKIAAQLTGKGITVKVDPMKYPNGRFAHLHDPEGNPLELWEPK